jgi:hypothetical protein
MVGCRVYFVVDNTYAIKLIEELVDFLKSIGVLSREVLHGIHRLALNSCDFRVEEVVRLAIRWHGYSCAVILVDTEGRNPQEVVENVVKEHVEPLGEYSRRVRVYPAHPCLETWLCELLEAESCSTGTCGDVVRAVETRLGRKYYKHELPTLTVRLLRERLGRNATSKQRREPLPNSLSSFVRTIEEACYSSQTPVL